MDTQHLLNVLSLLRSMKGKNTDNVTGTGLIKRWAGAQYDEIVALRMAAQIQEEIALAIATLENARLSDEAKEGILPKLNRLQEGFSLAAFNNPIKQYAPDVAGMITTIAVVIDASGVSHQPEPPKELGDLIDSIEQCIRHIDVSLDPIVKEVAIRHMRILVAMLQNLSIFGFEAALVAYFELMSKVKRADEQASPSDKAKSKGLVESLKSWADIITNAQKIWDAGSGVVANASEIVPLLTHK